MRTSRTRSVARAVLATVVVSGLVVAGTGMRATADPGSGGKGPAPSVSAPPTGKGCVERPSAGKSRSDEFLSCLGVVATLDRVPSVGETATLTVTVRASINLAPSDVRVELPKQLTWAQAPAGFGVGQLTSTLPERSGTISTAQRTMRLAAGQPVTFTGVVKAIEAGFGQIQVRATAADGADVQAGQDNVFLTVADAGKLSRLGSVAKGGDLPVAAVKPTVTAARPAWLEPRSVGTEGLAKPTPRGTNGTALACDTRVAGNWGYFDQSSAWHNSMNFQVQVRDLANGTLAVGITDGAGNFNICFDSALGTQMYVTFVSEVSQWRVQAGANPYNWSTGVVHNPVAGSTVNFGSLTTGDPADYRALHAYDEANDAWLFIPKPVNGCFDQNDATCRQLRINWARDSTDGTYYSTGGNDVHLAADDPNAAITVVHEIGHAIMDDVYNDAFPAAPSCNPHSIQGTSSAGCAWTEGWAEWFPATVYHDSFFRWPNGASLDLENASWGNGWGQGDTTEGRIAGSMIDITDSTNEATWDRYGEGFTGLWFTFTHHVNTTLSSFWGSRTGDGFNVADSGALAALYQNTVDYTFRDPLGNYAPLVRPTPTPHNFSFNTTSIYWSVVAVRPSGTDYDLALYDDRAQSVFLNSSPFGGSTIDFVAVDSNLRALGDYYPRAYVFSGAGAYGVELAQGTLILSAGTSATVTMGSANIVAVQDTFLTAGVPVTISVTPTNSGQDPELFLMGDDAANSATWIRPRAFAAATSAFAGPGATETLTYTPPTSGWYGVVVTNKAGSGNYTLTRA